jgi:hypothetical protein
MKVANSRVALIKEAIALEQQRSLLQAKLEPVLRRLEAITRELADGTASMASAGISSSPQRRPVAQGKINKRGELKDSIFSALKAAGPAGVRVQDMSKRFGVKVRNLFVWFSTTGRKFKQIKKVAPGRYRLVKSA